MNINDFLNHVSNGAVSAPSTTRKAVRKVPSVTIRTRDAAVTLTNFTTQRMALPSGPIMVHTYQGERYLPEMPAQTSKPALELVNYSERSFAIFGDTKPMQAKLEALGGKFNRWLKRDGIATPGFIFSIGRIDSVRKALNL